MTWYPMGKDDESVSPRLREGLIYRDAMFLKKTSTFNQSIVIVEESIVVGVELVVGVLSQEPIGPFATQN